MYKEDFALTTIFCISCRLGLPGIFFMCLSVSLLVILGIITITDTVVLLRHHIFSISIPRFLYLLILLLSSTDLLAYFHRFEYQNPRELKFLLFLLLVLVNVYTIFDDPIFHSFYYYNYYSFENFLHQRSLMVSH